LVLLERPIKRPICGLTQWIASRVLLSVSE